MEGAVISRSADGREEVSFPAPPDAAPAVSDATGPTIARFPEMPGASARPAKRPAPGGLAAEASSTPSMDEIYDAVVDRLRRDLVAERERIGDITGNL